MVNLVSYCETCRGGHPEQRRANVCSSRNGRMASCVARTTMFTNRRLLSLRVSCPVLWHDLYVAVSGSSSYSSDLTEYCYYHLHHQQSDFKRPPKSRAHTCSKVNSFPRM